MVTEKDKKNPYRIRITAIEDAPLELGSLTVFLYDLVLLHDRLLLILSDEYDYRRHLTLSSYRRAGRPIRKPDRLQIKLITKESPFAAELIIPAAAVVGWTLVQIVEKLVDWKDNRAIKRLQRRSLELGVELREPRREYIGRKLLQRYPGEAEEIEERVIRDAVRLGTNEQVMIDRVETLDTIKEGKITSEQADLWGEIHEDEIVKIAWEAAEKRGYAVYKDYNEYTKQLISQGSLDPVRAGRFLQDIRKTLLQHEWIPSPGHPETRFYPPGTELPNLGRRLR